MGEEQASLERLLAQRQRNLYKLKEKAAIYAAGEVPLHLQNQIDAEQKAIIDIETRLAGLAVEKEREPMASTPQPGKDEQLPPPVEIVTVRVGSWLIKVLRDPLWQGIAGVIAIITLIVSFVSMGGPDKVASLLWPTPTPTSTYTPTPTPTSTPTPTQTPTHTPTPTLTSTPPCPICINEAIPYDGHEGSSLEMAEGADPTRRDAIKIIFDNPLPGSFSAWVIPLHTCDVTASESLSFWVRGENGGEQFEVGIKGSTTESGHEPKVQQIAPAYWQQVFIPLQEFQELKEQDLSSLENFSLGFSYDLGSGTIYVDGFTFSPP